MQSPKAISLSLAAAAIGLGAAGCGSTAPPRPGSSAQNPASAAYAFSRCMRSHGVTGFPDPHVTTSGGSTSISQVAPASLASSPAFKSAQKACGHLEQAAQGAGPGGQGPNKQVLLAFARCLRAHGISGFPDPNAQGRLSLTTISAAGVNVHSHTFFTIARGCVGVTHGAITVAQVAALVNGSH